MAKLTDRCFCYRDFTAAMFVSPRRTQTWRLHTALLQITQEWKTAETWFLARLFIYQSSIVSRILNFIHWMVTIFSFDHTTGENREFRFLVPFLVTLINWIAVVRAALQPYIDDAGRKYYYVVVLFPCLFWNIFSSQTNHQYQHSIVTSNF